MEVLLRPAVLNGDSDQAFLSFSVPDNREQFLARQWTDGLQISRDSLGTPHRLRTAHLDVDHIFRRGELLFLTVTSGPGGTAVYANGRQAQTFPNFHIARSDLAGLLVLGGAADDFEPWQGEIRGLAIYARELTPQDALQHYLDWTDDHAGKHADLEGATARYDFAERAGQEIHNEVASGPALDIPKWFDVPRKPFLTSLADEYDPSWGYVSHVLANVVGFIPLGLIVCAYLTWPASKPRAILYTILFGGILSSAIEMIQVFIPERTSDQTDILANILGTVIGAVLAPLCVAYIQKVIASRRPSAH